MSKDDLFVNIQDIARQKTQRKDPVINGNGTNGHTHNGNGNGSSAGHTWKPPVIEEKKKEEQPAAAASSAEAKPAAEQEPVQRILSAEEEEKAKATGKVGAYLAGGLVEMIFGLTNTLVHVSSFTAEQKKMLVALEEKPEAEYTEQEKSLNMKFLAKTKKYEQRKLKIPLSKNEEEILREAFTDYRRVTGKDLNPSLILWSAITRICISRGMEIAF